jgi:hypothetical protein
MQKLDKQMKVKIFALFLMAQVCMFLLASPGEEQTTTLNNDDLTFDNRPDYIEFTIRADNRVSSSLGTPVVITNEKRSIYIPYSFVLKQLGEDTSIINDSFELDRTQNPEFSVYIHKKFAHYLMENHQFLIIPNLEEDLVLVKKKKGVRYEISI